MESFAEAREFVEYRLYARDREKVMSAFDAANIDAPILDVVQGFAALPYCFTLQCCFGHFMWPGQPDPRSFEALPARDMGPVTYNIAYLAWCIEPGAAGARLRESLAGLRAVDEEYVQFGSPGWFWMQYPNSYAIQVEPERFKSKDRAVVPHSEALHLQAVRDELFARLREVSAAAHAETGPG